MPRYAFFAVLSLPLLLFAVPASAGERFALQNDVDHVWVMTAAALVFMMQGGFLLLEAGTVRSKNSVNVAQKNLIDFILSAVCFGLFGFMLMFGASTYGLFGFSPELAFFGSTDSWSMTFFVFQLMFCGTAATIVSGAVAERMSMTGYICCTAAIALVIYPVAGHWVWGGGLTSSEKPFLAAWGFMDFAGGTVVHLLGGAVALAAIILIGPRTGKFDEDGNPREIHGHSPVLSTAGCLILWVGWIGFNGGSVTVGTEEFAHVVMNTMVAGALGGFAMLVIGRIASKYYRPEASINGVLAGLVSITPAASVVDTQSAVLIGVGGAALAYLSAYALENIAKLDDPLQAVSVHGTAGAFGTVMVGVFGNADALYLDSRLEQIGIQIVGVVIVFVWAFGMASILLRVAAAFIAPGPHDAARLRVNEDAEREGLNATEHRAPMGTGILAEVMAEMVRDPDREVEAIQLDVGDDAYELSVLLNRIVENIQAKRKDEFRKAARELARHRALQREVSDVITACADGEFSKRIQVDGRTGFELEMAERVNDLCDVTGNSLGDVRDGLNALSLGRIETRIDHERGGVLGEIRDTMNATMDTLEGTLSELQIAMQAASAGDFSSRINSENREGFWFDLCDGVNQICETSEVGLSDLGSVLERISQGDLDARMARAYLGKFAEIGRSMDRAANTLGSLIEGLTEASEQVSASSKEAEETSSQLHAQSERQVARLEETALVLADIDAMAADATARSDKSARMCNEALMAAEEGSEVAEATVASMTEMDRVTKDIVDSVEQIGEIAFRTHVLSINASVEAARQGNTSGFRVVAEEVRALAGRTAQVVDDIQAHTQEMTKTVGVTRDRVGNSREGLRKIVSAVSEATELARELSADGIRQADRATQAKEAATEVESHARSGLELALKTHSVAHDLADNARKTKDGLARFGPGDGTKVAA